MALKLRLRPSERVVINGCVVQNEQRRSTLTISNFAQIIRGNDLLQEEDADTPARRAYFLIQTMLLDPQSASENTGLVADMMAKLYTAFLRQDIQDSILRAMQHVSERDYYKALACLRTVMSHEATVLDRPARARTTKPSAIAAASLLRGE
jgi:flagellar protein FlbT